jgi:hypothetical protein
MTHFFSIAALGAALIVSAAPGLATPAPQTDFTGTWVLDTSRTEGLPEGIEQTMTVSQTGDRIEIETHSRTPTGERRTPDVYVLDGNETDYQPAFSVEASATNARRTSRWSESGNGFEATEHATIQGPEGQEADMSVVRTWTLAPDGNTLTIEMKISGPPGEMTTTRVFTRQEPTAG